MAELSASAATAPREATLASTQGDEHEKLDIDAIIQENNENSHENLENSSSQSLKLNDEDLYDEPEDLNTQTVIQNRYCFWCHRRGGKQSVC